MPVKFIPGERSAFDEESGISILRPRMLPCEQPEGGISIEYQYTFRRHGERVGALGMLGDKKVVCTSGHPVLTYTLNLRPAWVIRDILRMKEIFRSSEPDLTFLRGIAHGLVTSFADQTTNAEALRYIALTSDETLVGEGIFDRLAADALPGQDLILADVVVPAHTA